MVSIGGSLTEIIYALGEESHLVARDTTATYPEAATKLPDVGYMRALSPEGVLSVNPSALLVVQGSGPADALALLSSAGGAVCRGAGVVFAPGHPRQGADGGRGARGARQGGRRWRASSTAS